MGLVEPENSRVVHISNTLHVGEVLVSEAYLSEVESRDDLEILEAACEMEFDAGNNLLPVAAAGATAGVL